MGKANISPDGTLTAVVTDLSDQLRYQEIVREEKLSRSIMDNSPDGVAVCDTNGLVIRTSKTLNDFCHQSALMKAFDEVFHIEISVQDGKPELFTISNVLAGRHLRDAEGRLYCVGREAYYVRLNAIPLLNEEQCYCRMPDFD